MRAGTSFARIILWLAAAACSPAVASARVDASPQPPPPPRSRGAEIVARLGPIDAAEYADVTEAVFVPAAPESAREPRPSSLEDARARYNEAVSAYESGDLSKLVPMFRAAYVASGNPRLLYNLGEVARQLGAHGAAYAYLRAYLDRGATSGQRRDEVERELRELEGRTGWLALRCSADIVRLAVDEDIDATALSSCPFQRRIRVAAGAHRIVAATRDSRTPTVANVEVSSGATTAVDIQRR